MALVGTAMAQASVGDVLQKAAKLDQQRLIEIQAATHLELVNGGRAFAEQIVDGIARNEVHQQEHEHADTEDRRDASDEPAAKKATLHERRLERGDWRIARGDRRAELHVLIRAEVER